MLILTAGMLCMMFLPNAAQRFTGGLVSLGGRLRLVRHEAQTREKLARQMAAYREGAACIRANLNLLPALLLITFLQLTALYAVPYVVYLGFGLRAHSLFQLLGAQALVSMAVGSLPLPAARAFFSRRVIYSDRAICSPLSSTVRSSATSRTRVAGRRSPG